eukprot:s597_g24.t1
MDSNAAFKRNMDDLNDMMESRGLEPSLRVRMRKYMHECIVAQQQATQERLLRNTISPGLQREVAQSSQRDLLKNIYWAQEALAKAPEMTPGQRKEVEEKLSSLLEQMKPNPKPGTSNEAKKFKDELAKDPYNMTLIFELGKAYSVDEQWDRCANVLLRGFKRVSELEAVEDRFNFLVVLAQASLHLEKYRQALAVINDIADPDDTESLRGLNILRCQVYCLNGEMQKGLKAFNAAITGDSFEVAVKAWASCSRALKQANAWVDERKQLESIEKLCDFKATLISLYAGAGASLLSGLLLKLLLRSRPYSWEKDENGDFDFGIWDSDNLHVRFYILSTLGYGAGHAVLPG